MVWWVAGAWAQDVISGGALPEIDAQNFRPSVDASRALWVDEAARAPSGAVGRLLFHYTDDPLVYRTEDATVGLVRNLVQADVIGGWTFGPVRVGLVVPLYLYASGDTATGSGLGDLALDARLTVIDGDRTPVDLALQGRVSAPTATLDLPLGNPGFGWEITAVASRRIDRLLLAANLGTTGGPDTELENVRLDDAFTARAAVGVDLLPDELGLTGEVASHVSYTSPEIAASSPTEALLSGWGRPGRDLVIRGGAGLGLTPGIGSPDFRLLVGLGYSPGAAAPAATGEPKVADADGDGLLDPADACPADPEDLDGWQDQDGCPDLDDDADGLVDTADGCRSEPEDVDGWHDEDGCPDPTTLLTVAVVDEANQPIELAKGVISAPDGRSWTVPGARLSVEVPAGTYAVDARAATYLPGQVTVEVPDGPPVGTFVVLHPQRDAKVVVTRERIDLKDKVYFETASAKIKPESYGLLDQAVQVLRDYPEIVLLRIEGHTDTRGSDSYNLKLSKERAASVRQYLVDHGIAPERVTSEGYGETRPLDPANDEQAWSKNRRVDFFIERWEDAPLGR